MKRGCPTGFSREHTSVYLVDIFNKEDFIWAGALFDSLALLLCLVGATMIAGSVEISEFSYKSYLAPGLSGNPNVGVLNKVKRFDDMCKSLWSAYKDRMQTAARVMAYDIGFLFQENSSFEEGCKAFVLAKSPKF